MRGNLDYVYNELFRHEGGYAERAAEGGGAVNMGITFTTFKDYWKFKNRPGEPTYEDLKKMTKEEAKEAFWRAFLNPIDFDRLPDGVDYALTDFAIHSGVGGALRQVSKKMGFAPTRKMTPQLSWALRTRDPARTIQDIMDERLRFMMSLDIWEDWADGWGKRAKKVRERALKMIKTEEDDGIPPKNL